MHSLSKHLLKTFRAPSPVGPRTAQRLRWVGAEGRSLGDSQESSLFCLTLPKDLFRLRTERKEGKAIPSFFWGGRGGRKDFREERLGSGCDRRVSIPQERVMGAVQEEGGGKRLK